MKMEISSGTFFDISIGNIAFMRMKDDGKGE